MSAITNSMLDAPHMQIPKITVSLLAFHVKTGKTYYVQTTEVDVINKTASLFLQIGKNRSIFLKMT